MRTTRYFFLITVLIGAVLLAGGLITHHWPEIANWLAQHGIQL